MFKNEQTKKGRTYLIWSVVCLVISYVFYLADIGGAIAGLVSFAMVVLFIGGLAYLIIGFMKKE
jgi:hypothetical protein